MLASVGVTIWALAAVLLVVLNFAAPQLNDVRTGSPIAIIAAASFVVGAIATLTGFPLTYRQADRERLAGYTTMRWRSYRWLPVVNPRTLVIEHGQFTQWDPTTARARTPWATTPSVKVAQAPWVPLPLSAPSRASIVVAGTVSAALSLAAAWSRVQHGAVSTSDNLFIGAVVTGSLLVATFAFALVLRAVQSNRLATISGLTSGIIVACFSAPEIRGSAERLGLEKRSIPRIPVLVFDQDGFTIWRASGVPAPLVSFPRRDVLDVGTFTIVSGRAFSPGMEITVVPPDERWPFLMTFTVFDPTRIFATASNGRIQAIANSVTELWTGNRI
jgi:hypothetical protein